MYLKYYAVLPNFHDKGVHETILDYYTRFMAAEVHGDSKSFIGLRLYGEITLNFAEGGEQLGGAHVIKFLPNEASKYEAAVAKIKEAARLGLVNVTINEKAYNWGTTLFEFTDPFGLCWDFEIATEARGEKVLSKARPQGKTGAVQTRRAK